jgi:hypothetical protein
MIDVDGDMKTKCVCQNLVKISSLKAAFFSEILLNAKKKLCQFFLANNRKCFSVTNVCK